MVNISELKDYFLKKHTLLWVCQKYDLRNDEIPHDFSIHKEQAILKYRDVVSDEDKQLASIYWEEVWIEGIISQVFDAIKTQFDNAKGRRPIVLASEADVKVSIQNNTFLPVNRLYGVVDDRLPKSAQFGVVRPRIRESLARSLSSRLQLFSDRILVVVGANESCDLDLLFDAFEDYPTHGLKAVIISENQLDLTRAQGILDVSQIELSLSDFLKEIKRFGAPSAEQVSGHSIRYGDGIVQVPGEMHDFIDKEFTPICENDLIHEGVFSLDDFMAFLDGSLENWSGFSVGMPVQRDYITEDGRDFYGELSRIIEQSVKVQDRIVNYYVEMPTEGGAGSTTLVRNAVFNCALRGIPVLVFKPFQTDYTLDKLHAYMNNFIELGIKNGIKESLPFIVVFDKPQSSVSNIKQIPSYMGIHGKKIIIISVFDALESNSYSYEQRGGFVKLPKVKAEASKDEVISCANKFKEIVQIHKLPIQVPTIENWFDTENAQVWKSNASELRIESFFWVALRYFYTEGLDTFTADVARDNLGKWIAERYQRVRNSSLAQLINYVAVFSSWKILSPLWPLLRPITGGRFSSEISEALRTLNDLIDWGGYSENISDHVIGFKHPTLAAEILRQQDIKTNSEKIQLIKPVILQLSAGHGGDVWLAKALSYDVLAPRGDKALLANDRDWRLEGFELIPPEISENDKSILHHWARCLYQSARNGGEPLDVPTQQKKYQMAIEKLVEAIKLPRTNPKQEPLSQLYNTLGTAYARYAAFLEDNFYSKQEIESAWSESFAAFTKGLDTTKWQDIKALLSFSYRLISKNRNIFQVTMPNESEINNYMDALFMLEQAEDMISASQQLRAEHEQELHKYRSQIFSASNSEAFRSYIMELKKGKNPEIGYYCEAKAILNNDPDTGRSFAIEIMNEARAKYKLGTKSLSFMIMLYRSDPIFKYNFNTIFELYGELEKKDGFVMRPIDMFRFGVLCYQIERFDEGRERFRVLRSVMRREDIPFVPARDFWRDKISPDKPRETYLKVQRILSEWKGEVLLEEVGQVVPFRPRHFQVLLQVGQVERCGLRFELNGPIAVPTRFLDN